MHSTVTSPDTSPRPVHRLSLDTEAATARLAEAVAASARAGDAILLEGDLGAGKTTFARAFLRAVADDETLEVPSPTFTLLQIYDLPRLRVAHIDLYRLADPQELDELGLDDYSGDGVVIVEWPERGGDRFGGDCLHIVLETGADPDKRLATLTADGSWADRLDRLVAVRTTLAGLGYEDWHRRFLKGDASTRRYERLDKGDDKAVLMDSPAMPDPGTGTVPYSRIAHLAEAVTPFVAIADALKAHGFSTPDIRTSDLGEGILVLEDLGTDTVLDDGGRPVQDRYCAALDVLAALHRLDLPDHAEVAPGLIHHLPRYDLGAFMAEVDLMPAWFARLATGGSALPEAALDTYRTLWRDLLFDLTDPDRHGAWVLRDYHSPNLMWLADRDDFARVGLLDIQDAVIGPAAYDVASLIFDARVDIPERMRRELYAYYIAERQIADPAFDVEAFDCDFAILAVQRTTKILGIFARLYLRDGKPDYLAHFPRLSAYLEAALTHPVLAGLKLWYDTHLPHVSRLRAAETLR